MQIGGGSSSLGDVLSIYTFSRPSTPLIYRIQQQRCQLRVLPSSCREVTLQVTTSSYYHLQWINLNLTGTALAGPCSEITPRRCAVLVALHHGLPQVGLAPVSFRNIEAMLGIPKSTCCNIYKHALKNATHRHLHVPPPATPNPELPQAIQHPE